jgi:hypothetical protein
LIAALTARPRRFRLVYRKQRAIAWAPRGGRPAAIEVGGDHERSNAGRVSMPGKAEPKTKPTAVSVGDFIDAVGNETRRSDAKTLLAMMKKATGEKPVMWGPSIVGFGKRRYKYESGREGEVPIAGFSPRKANLVLYLAHCPERDALLRRLGKHKTGVGCLYVNKLADVDMAALEELVAKSVAHARTLPEMRSY